MERELKTINGKLRTMSGDVDDLEKKVESLKVEQNSQPATNILLVDLNKQEYKPGDSLTLTGTGLPNKSVSALLLDVDKLTLSQSSNVADSNGKFTFTIQLSRSLTANTYTIKVSQEGKVIERSFRIAGIIETPAQISSSTQGLTLSVDRGQYARGDRVFISGKADPNVFIDLDIFDSNKVPIVRSSTKSDANGNYALEYAIPSNAASGEYELRATMGSKQTSVKFLVGSSTSSTTVPSSSPSTSGTLTITSEKATYKRGDLAKITGKAPPNSKVTIFVEPPSGDKLVLSAVATNTGNYITLLSINGSASIGNWKLNANLDNNVEV
ncbi:MAG: hypothetical protein ACRD32_09110, partial [Nitrososphaerales archaeon]